jgi:hypothetical protein
VGGYTLFEKLPQELDVLNNLDHKELLDKRLIAALAG